MFLVDSFSLTPGAWTLALAFLASPPSDVYTARLPTKAYSSRSSLPKLGLNGSLAACCQCNADLSIWRKPILWLPLLGLVVLQMPGSTSPDTLPWCRF